MPFKSRRQMRFLFANHPRIAQRFADHTSKAQMKRLPERAKKRRR